MFKIRDFRTLAIQFDVVVIHIWRFHGKLQHPMFTVGAFHHIVCPWVATKRTSSKLFHAHKKIFGKIVMNLHSEYRMNFQEKLRIVIIEMMNDLHLRILG